MSDACRHVRDLLDEYLHEELSGAQRLGVSDHLRSCAACADESRALRGLGEALRLSAVRTVPTDALAGLAGGVTSRVKAEDSQSWTASWNRVFEDWHWVAVGFGAVTAAMAMFTLASLMLYSSVSQLMQPIFATCRVATAKRSWHCSRKSRACGIWNRHAVLAA
jgi:anti-sigma factor RsiW